MDIGIGKDGSVLGLEYSVSVREKLREVIREAGFAVAAGPPSPFRLRETWAVSDPSSRAAMRGATFLPGRGRSLLSATDAAIPNSLLDLVIWLLALACPFCPAALGRGARTS